MIIQSLVHCYDQLRENPNSGIAQPGWCSRQVRFLLELSPEGLLKAVIPCGDGKHGVEKIVPEQVKRSSGVAANYLCDTSSYLLGLDGKGKPGRSRKCFEASRALHLSLLKECSGTVARAIVGFYQQWDPDQVDFDAVPGLSDEGILAAGNISFCVSDGSSWIEACDDEEVRSSWCSRCDDDDGQSEMISLATGMRGPVARLHPAIKGVVGAQSSGASLVGFNAESFESYGHVGEQGRNAPVDVVSTQAYATALNYLLADRRHYGRLGDTTVVFWSSSQASDQGNCSVLALALGFAPVGDSGSQTDVQQNMKAIMDRIASGKPVDIDDVSLGDDFFLLGLAPNAARLAVRFFLHGSFGEMMRHVADHYRISDVAHAPNEFPYVSPYWLLKSLENPNAKKPVVSSQLSAPLMQAILRGGRYPESMYENVLLRVRAEGAVKREHAAIIRSYLIRNAKKSEREVTVNMNADSKDVAYTLGRAFYVLEHIQEEANGSSTIADRYLSAACSTPATTFPVLLKLSVAHLSKLSREKHGMGVFLEKQLGDLMARQGSGFPKRLSLVDQGSFLLGYYQQKQARYEKKTNQDNQD